MLYNVNKTLLKDAERVVRCTMVLIMLSAGISKFFSQGDFFEHYSALFQGDLRIVLPRTIVDAYLALIPYIEVSLGLALLSSGIKPYTTYAWFGFYLSLLFGHYILQQWPAVNQMLDYIFLGLLCFVLPAHKSLLRRDPA